MKRLMKGAASTSRSKPGEDPLKSGHCRVPGDWELYVSHEWRAKHLLQGTNIGDTVAGGPSRKIISQ